MNTNIVTVRRYKDGSKSVSINGRVVADVRAVANRPINPELNSITLQFDAVQYNELDGDEYLAPRALPVTKQFGFFGTLRRWWSDGV